MELIDKMGVIRALVEHKENIKDFGELKAYIDRLHTEESRPKGKWKEVLSHGLNGVCCGRCGGCLVTVANSIVRMNFCPFCGADMRGEE